jgi:Asp-tRNA(Asn)/Glu-tRNA(Gln) amidotransferase A subunit family amidase
VTARARSEECLKRIASLEPRVQAFAWLDEATALERADELDRSSAASGPLHGLPLGVKDIIDTAGIPTECGTHVLAGRVPAASARVVTALESAGVVVIGKTVTAELAFAAPGPTRNPWNTERTSGGSSMGSAAAVGGGMVPAAIGTQTNSSVIMPAALCGAVGFKPTGGILPTEGVLAFSPTLDQMGCFAQTVDDAAGLAAGMGLEPVSPDVGSGAPSFAVARTSDWPDAAEGIRREFERNLAALRRAGAQVDESGYPAELDGARAVHRTIMAYEAARALEPLVGDRVEDLSGVLQRFLREGQRIPHGELEQALAERERLTRAFAVWAAGYDAVLTPAAPDEAPGLEGTGDPRFCTRWTLVGAPAIVLPVGLGPQGLPIGLQLVGAPGADDRLVAAARFIERVLPAPNFGGRT